MHSNAHQAWALAQLGRWRRAPSGQLRTKRPPDDSPSAQTTAATEPRRRADRRRRHLRHRRRLPPAGTSSPARPTRSSRRATRSAAPGTCSATRASARTPTCTRSATRSSRGRGDKAIADGDAILDYVRETAERERHRPPHPLRPPGARAPRGRATRRAGPSRSSAPTPASRAIDRRLAVLRQRLLPLRRGLHAPTSRASSASPAQVVHPQHWPEDLDYAGKRVVVIGSGATAVTLVPAMAGDGRARDDAAALAELRPAAARRRTRRQLAARAARRGARLRDHAPQERPAARRAVYALSPALPERRAPAHPRASTPAAARAATRRRHALQPAATTRGTSGCARSPTATCSSALRKGERVGRHRPRSRRFTETRHPARVRPASSRPTSSSPRPGLNLLAFGGIELDGRRRARSRCPNTLAYKGDDAQRRPELRLRDRLHELVLDAEGRPRLRAPLPRCSATWTPPATTPAVPESPTPRCETPAAARLPGRLRPARARPLPAPGRRRRRGSCR